MTTNLFDMSVAVGAKTSNGSTNLKAGIHTVMFKGIIKDQYQDKTTGEFIPVMDVLFESPEGGTYKHRLFAPTSAERPVSEFNGNTIINPSHVEQFMCTCRQIIEALNPQLHERIENGEVKFSAKNFKDFIELMHKATINAIDKVIDIKLLPNKDNFTFPAYPAKINKDGVLYVSTKFIGNKLTLSSYEVGLIAKVANAAPSLPKIFNSSNNTLNQLESHGDLDTDDLPF